jgi:hypothetical protein
MPTSPLTMAQNMKAAMVPKIIGFDRKRDYELGRVRGRAPRCRPGRRALIVGEVDGRAASQARTFSRSVLHPGPGQCRKRHLAPRICGVLILILHIDSPFLSRIARSAHSTATLRARSG